MGRGHFPSMFSVPEGAFPWKNTSALEAKASRSGAWSWHPSTCTGRPEPFRRFFKGAVCNVSSRNYSGFCTGFISSTNQPTSQPASQPTGTRLHGAPHSDTAVTMGTAQESALRWIYQRFSIRDDFVPHPFLGDIWQCLNSFLVVMTWVEGRGQGCC